MQSQQFRRQFLNYFKKNHHSIIPSSPVVPHDDPTLLFINAGMNQFKDVFLGKSARDYTRAATSQKCIRVGGKHNDLENVGHTRRHLTFFEMLGNFSFGDYFKKDAIKFAWEVATEVYGFDPKRIWPTVYLKDDEAFELWTQYVPADRITRMDEKTNFWAMGDTGPCGPCSELLYDRGPAYGSGNTPKEDVTEERFMEFWNLVFMQYNRQPDGQMLPLPKPSIDTGAGLERVVALKLDVDNVFETDILASLIAQTEKVTGVNYDKNNDKIAPAFHVIADHLRCLAFAIADGAQPSNVDRGYVLRKVLRRAVRYGRQLGIDKPFMAQVLPKLVETMGSDYPEIVKGEGRIAEILTVEEEAFLRTLKRGGNILNQVIESSKTHGNTISGDDAFKLKDTYGLPLDEILLLGKDAGLTIDLERYKILEGEAKERSRSAQKTVHQVASENLFANFAKEMGTTEFLGYTQHSAVAKIVGLVTDGNFVNELHEGQEGIVLLDKTPFYAEMGGQIGDIGVLKGERQRFTVDNTGAPYKGIIAHYGTVDQGSLKIGDFIDAELDAPRRQKIANNHTATHLLHWALHKVLGEHVKQAGSVVDQERLRFDFSHHKALTREEIQQIEDLVNEKIRENLPVRWYEIAYDEAQKRTDIKQFFGEKYASTVRVIDIDYSKELCGGTHTSAVGNIGLFRIAKESSIAAGVRRIEAVTGAAAEALSRESDQLIDDLAALLKSQPTKLKERLEKLLEENKQQLLDLKAAKKKELQEVVHQLVNKVETHNGARILAAELHTGMEELRLCADDLFQKLQPSIVLVLGTKIEDKCHILVRVSDDLVAKGIQANKIVQTLAPLIEGSGGGKPNSAQAGGKAPQKLGEALAKSKELI
jgi:alanyl-tRNA synthetase